MTKVEGQTPYNQKLEQLVYNLQEITREALGNEEDIRECSRKIFINGSSLTIDPFIRTINVNWEKYFSIAQELAGLYEQYLTENPELAIQTSSHVTFSLDALESCVARAAENSGEALNSYDKMQEVLEQAKEGNTIQEIAKQDVEFTIYRNY